jgi:large subunit ribosomal protein L35
MLFIANGRGYRCEAEEEKMPKMKTNRGAAKRLKVTGGGKVIRYKAFANHILTKKSTKRKRGLRKSGLVDSANLKQVAKLLPYH